MKKIGLTSTGNVVVEMSSEEFDALDLVISPKKSAAVAGPVAKTMSVKSIAEYAAPRLVKLGAKRKDGVIRSIAAMFQTTGGIEEAKISQVFSELVRLQVLQEDDGKIKYNGAEPRGVCSPGVKPNGGSASC